MASTDSPEILLLSLSYQDYFDEMYSSLLDQLHRVARVKRAKTKNAAIHYLETNNPRAIIITDDGMAKRKSRHAILEKVLSYTRNGGLLIVGLQFPNFTSQAVFDNFFQDVGLSWRRGDYHRTTFEYNSSSSLHPVTVPSSFPGAYSMKVLHVKDAKPEEKIFIPESEAQTQSLVFAPEYVDRSQAAVVGAKIGNGYLAYCGDVNTEEGSCKVILALCGF